MKKQIQITYIGLALVITLFSAAQVVNASAQPVAGIEVTARSTSTGASVAMKTNADGTFMTSNLADDKYDLYVGSSTIPAMHTISKNGVIAGRLMIEMKGDASVAMPPLEKGKFSAEQLRQLKALLQSQGAITASDVSKPVRTVDNLKSAIRKFQKSQGISTTGTIGPMTLKALNQIKPLPPTSDASMDTTGTVTPPTKADNPIR